MPEGVNLTEKNVILFIVEGTSDKVSFQSVLENYFDDLSVKVEVMYGDITLMDNVNPGYIKGKLSDKIQEFCQCERIKFITASKNKDKKNNSDIKRIVHLIDTDGVFISNDLIKQASVSHIEYTENEIFAHNKEKIENRNFDKRAVLNKLCCMNTLNDIPYEVYFFSRNLEHVLHNRSDDVSDWEKQELSEKFDDLYADDLDGFLKFIKDRTFAVPGEYKDTWNFIKQDDNSLKRYCNFHLLFSK